MRIRYDFFNNALLSCFLVYAISPLSFACSSFANVACPPGQEETGFKNFSIYYFEVVLKSFFPPGDDTTAPARDSILAIKKHAVVRLSSALRQKLVKHAAIVESVADISLSWSLESARADAGLYQSAEVPAYSGLSPPSPSM